MNKIKNNQEHQRAFTLLEMIISISILAIISGAAAVTFYQVLLIQRRNMNKTEAAQQAALINEWLEKDILNSSCLFEASPNSITIQTADYDCIRYIFQNNTLMRQATSSGIGTYYPVIEGIPNNGFTLRYYDALNQQITNPQQTDLTNVRAIEIDLTTQKEDQSFRLNTLGRMDCSPQKCLWARTYRDDYGTKITSLQQTSGGGYILGGEKGLSGNMISFLLIKTDINGNPVWTKVYGGSTSENKLSSLQQTADGGYILGGTAGFYDMLVAKIDANGNKIWAKKYDGGADDSLHSIQQTSDGGYILGGKITIGAGNPDFWVIKTDDQGNISGGKCGVGQTCWNKNYGGTAYDALNSIQQTSEGGYILGGYTDSFGAGSKDFLVIKIDANGNKIWAYAYGGGNEEQLTSLQQTADGGYILGGTTTSFGTSKGILAIKIDADGNEAWAHTYGGVHDTLSSLQQTYDGGYVLGGINIVMTNVMVWNLLVIKTDAGGNQSWIKAYRGYGDKREDELTSLKQTADGGYILGGWTRSSFGGTVPAASNALLIKTNSSGGVSGCMEYSPNYTSSDVTGNVNRANADITPGTPSLTPETTGDEGTLSLITTLVCPRTN